MRQHDRVGEERAVFEARQGRLAGPARNEGSSGSRPEGFGECDSPECDRRAVAVVRHPLLEGGALEVCEWHAERALDLGACPVEWVVSA